MSIGRDKGSCDFRSGKLARDIIFMHIGIKIR